MLTAMILICSLTNTPSLSDCSQHNARDVLWVPETFNNPVTCFMHGQAYIAGTSLGRNLRSDERIVSAAPGGRADGRNNACFPSRACPLKSEQHALLSAAAHETSNRPCRFAGSL